jgi:ACS family hexuronate transporter-like MFS transporter
MSTRHDGAPSPSDDAPRPRLSAGAAWRVAIVATLAMTVSYVDRQVLAAVATSVRHALHFGAEQFGWLAASFSAAYLVATPVAGALIDRVGARRGLAASLCAWSIVSAAHAFAPSFGALLALRLALAAGESPSFPGAVQCVHRALPERGRSAAVGLLFTGSSLGAVIAAPLAIAIDVKFGWRAAFAITSAAGLVWVPAWLFVTRKADVRVLLADAPPAPKSAAETTAFRVATDPIVVRAAAMVVTSAPALMFVLVWMPQYLEIGLHVPKAELPRYVWVPPILADVGMVGAGWLRDRLGARTTDARSQSALAIVAGALVLCMALAASARHPWASVLLMGLGVLGAGALYTLLTADMIARVSPSQVSAAAGLTAAAQSMTYVVLSPLVGRWVDRTGSFDGPLVLFGSIALPGAIGWSLTRSVGENAVARGAPGQGHDG